MAKKYAVLVGTSKFNDEGLKTLYAPEEDVTRFRDVLKNKNLAAFDDVRICMNSDMTSVRTNVAELFSTRAADDLVLFYYSGHGLIDTRGRLYFSLPETDSEEPSSRSLEASFVRQQMDDSNSLRQIIVLDCCHSGAFKQDDQLVARDANAPILTAQTFDPKGHGRFVLSASAASESSFEKNGKSIYTQTLVEGLETGDAAPEKPEISVADLHNYISQKVKSTDTPMQPHFWIDNQTEPLVISQNPNRIVPIGQQIIDGINSDNPMARVGAVQQLGNILTSGSAYQREEALTLLNERASDPNEVKMVFDAVTEVLQKNVPAKELQVDRPTPIEEENETPPPMEDNKNREHQNTGDNLFKEDISESNDSNPGRLFAAFQSAILSMSLLFIVFLISLTLDTSRRNEEFWIFSIPITLGITVLIETWRRNAPFLKSICSMLIFIASMYTLSIISINIIDLLVLLRDEVFIAFFLGASFIISLTFCCTYSFSSCRNIKLLFLFLAVGSATNFAMIYLFHKPNLSMTEFVLSFVPLIFFMYFLVFSFASFSQLRSIKRELGPSLRQLVRHWNTGKPPNS